MEKNTKYRILETVFNGNIPSSEFQAQKYLGDNHIEFLKELNYVITENSGWQNISEIRNTYNESLNDIKNHKNVFKLISVTIPKTIKEKIIHIIENNENCIDQ